MLHEPPGCFKTKYKKTCIFAVFTFLVRSIYLSYHYTDHDVSDWRIHKKTCAATLGTLAGVVLAGSFEKAYLKKSLICPTMICINRFRASTLAQAMCGVMISFLLSLRPEIRSSC